ncbi:GRAM domain-containing protein 2B-like [Pseudoliparis swirei]|uniref:GRAM domain-containing protein 2B-like n=1 Tax=Pseudoliparis swirei TaxID=2059687 RepID=UPI0024BD6D91|nr:GRAM domain-containing protein 2B-like [Pseudoliparis swirei]
MSVLLSSDSGPARGGVLDRRRGSSRLSVKKLGESDSLDDARQEIQELHHSLNSNIVLRKQTIAEENVERSDGLIHKNSSVKHSKTFHKLFQEIPVGENLMQTFSCALQKEVLYHGKLFVSENYVCFYSSVLLKDTKVVIPASSIQGVKKHNSTLSMLSIQTADGEKHTLVSLRHRELCYKLLQAVHSHVQEPGVSSSPHVSSPENEADHGVPSSYSSLEDCGDLSRENSIHLDNAFPLMSSEATTRRNSTLQNTDQDTRAVSWIWRITERVSPLLLLREMRTLSALFYVFMMLTVLLLLASGYIGLRIIALEEQLSELSVQHGGYQQVEPVPERGL